MAEKRGQFSYNDDGTVSQLVTIAGADSTGGVVNTTTNDILPYDHQATLTNTAVTHTSAVIAPSGTSTQSAWQLVPEGMTEFINNLTIDVANTNVMPQVLWSEDGTNESGRTFGTVGAESLTAKTSKQWYPVGGAFYKASLFNGDAASRTCSANIKFRP